MKKLILASFLLYTLGLTAQTTYSSNAIDLVVSGTSTLHDWDMKSAKTTCTASFTVNAAGQLSALNSLIFSTPTNSLKSEHSSMDNNAYKALKSEQNPAITYVLSSATISPVTGDASSVNVKVAGKLTIAGASKDEELVAVCKLNADNTITVTGNKKISMKDYNMQPPTFMMGTIKTGNDITLKFKLVLKK